MHMLTLCLLLLMGCRVDMILVGAEGVVENGGVINKLGTYQLAICAREHKIPFYVAAESYKVWVPFSLCHVGAAQRTLMLD